VARGTFDFLGGNGLRVSGAEGAVRTILPMLEVAVPFEGVFRRVA
jgi:hypothetical protein